MDSLLVLEISILLASVFILRYLIFVFKLFSLVSMHQLESPGNKISLDRTLLCKMNKFHVEKRKYDYEIYHTNFNYSILKEAEVL